MDDNEKAQFEEGWKALNVNGDDYIEKKDIEEFFKNILRKTLEGGHATEAQIEEEFEKKNCSLIAASQWNDLAKDDTDGDGKISKEEFHARVLKFYGKS